jgi:Icc-related predicted phosphoesterase
VKLLIMSDLHFEFHRDGGRAFCERYLDFNDYDVAVVAGDLCSFEGIGTSVRRLSQSLKNNVLLVSGNHECYGSSVKGALSRLRASCETTIDEDRDYDVDEKMPAAVHVLENETCRIGSLGPDGQRFVGCTLWFPHDIEGKRIEWTMNDFNLILGLSAQVGELHRRSKEWLWDTLTRDDVLVTHHLPSWKSVHPKYAKSNLNHFFVGDIEALIWRNQPKLVIHGHTHESCDYRIGDTRVICNPYGYQGREVNPNFVERMVVEI